MKAEDFSAWLSAIAGLSAEQRGEALQALAARGEKERAPEAADWAQRPAKKGVRRGHREDALGTTSHERVESQGCPHCAAREVVGWGRSTDFCASAARAAGARSTR